MVPCPAASEAAQQDVHGDVHCGLDLGLGGALLRVHFHQVHGRQQAWVERDTHGTLRTREQRLRRSFTGQSIIFEEIICIYEQLVDFRIRLITLHKSFTIIG